jgi:hypothetical protein
MIVDTDSFAWMASWSLDVGHFVKSRAEKSVSGDVLKFLNLKVQIKHQCKLNFLMEVVCI